MLEDVGDGQLGELALQAARERRTARSASEECAAIMTSVKTTEDFTGRADLSKNEAVVLASGGVIARVVVLEDAVEGRRPPAPCPKLPTWHRPTPWPQPLPVNTKRVHVARRRRARGRSRTGSRAGRGPSGPCRPVAGPARPSLPDDGRLDHAAGDAEAPGHDVAHRARRCRSARWPSPPRPGSCGPPSGSSFEVRSAEAPSRLCSASRNVMRPSWAHEADLVARGQAQLGGAQARSRRGSGRAAPRGRWEARSRPRPCARSGRRPTSRGTRAETRAGGAGRQPRCAPAAIDGLRARDGRVAAAAVLSGKG